MFSYEAYHHIRVLLLTGVIATYRSTSLRKANSYQHTTNEKNTPMKNYTCCVAWTMIVLALTAIQNQGQTAYEPYTFISIAGSPGYGSRDGTGSTARFNRPLGVAVDSGGNVYVAETFNNTIRKGYPAPRILNPGPSFGFIGGQFGFVLTGPAGHLVVVEGSNDLVSWLPLWTNTFAGAFQFSDPQSCVFSKRFYRVLVP